MFQRFCFLVILTFTSTIAVNADIPRTMYVINEAAETLSKMEMESFSIEQNILSTGQIPNQIAVHNNMLYLVNSGTDDILVIDPQNDGTVVKTIALPEGSNPWAIGFVGINKAYVTNFIANKVSIIDLDAGVVTGEISVGTGPEGILVIDNRAFVANTGYAGWGVPYKQATVSIIDVLTDSVTHTLAVPTNAQDLAVDSWGRIHVVCSGDYTTVSGQVAVIDLYTGPMWDTPAVIDTVEFGWITPGTVTFQPGDITITKDDKAYCVAWGNGTNGFMCSYNAISDSVLRSAADPILIGPNVSQLYYDKKEDALWIPTMTVWGGDAFIQKFDTSLDSVIWISNVIGNGSKSLAILEPILNSDPGADAVVSFKPGTGAGFGANFFPGNVLGGPDPDPSISEHMPSVKPSEILSLGRGGEIVLEFIDNYINDGEGADFTVFENAFISLWTGLVSIEAGIVSVSMDGVTFVEFPYDTATFAGLAGVTPTKDTQHPTDPAVSGGDQFDLADVGLSHARFVKITDLGDIKEEAPGAGDFDLDAVVAINSKAGTPTSVDKGIADMPTDFQLSQNYPNPFNPETTITFTVDTPSHVKLTVFNQLGQAVTILVNGKIEAGTHQATWNGRDYQGHQVASGIYFYQLKSSDKTEIRKMTLMK